MKKTIALKLLKNRTVRRGAMRLLGDRRVRRIVARQVSRRIFGR